MRTYPRSTIRIGFTLLMGVVLFNSCNYINNVRLLTGGGVNSSNFTETISFKYLKGLIVVDAQLNNYTTYHQFIFDTGAFNSKIEFKLAEELGLSVKAIKDNSTAQGISRKIEVVRADKVKIGSIEFTKIGAGKLQYDAKSASPCIAEDGIIGANLIKLAHWKIDYQKQKMSFSDSPLRVPNNEKSYLLPFKKPLLSGVPEIEIEVAGRILSGVLFDVGFNGGLVLPAKFAEAFESDSVLKVIDQSTSGIYGTNIDTLTTKRLEVSVGGFRSTIPVEFSSIGKALLGNEYLQHFDVFINYDSKKISLVHKKEIRVEFGRTFIPGMLNDSLWIVNRTTPNNTLVLGDTLETINGKKPSDLFKNYCDYFMNISELMNREKTEVKTTSGEVIIVYQ